MKLEAQIESKENIFFGKIKCRKLLTDEPKYGIIQHVNNTNQRRR